uniref:NADH-ubiquinone oxidoreductase chain 3 n=1 Tax=Aphaenogaster famelica TaxID=255788 RepID=A0A6B9BK01_9HYME|nr:NADH dehydrogenase subunit 3 [Aphaenogaster famelica]QGW36321.1 NADH dehydrogenase subunit 3 [Aphaenogaster famelica]
MIQMLYIMMILMLIAFIFMLLNYLLSKKSFSDREKMSPFECGFNPMSLSRLPFSIQFFTISLIFLIFDIEIALLIPLIFCFTIFNPPMIYTSIFFILILMYGLYMEYLEQSIDWKM